jgi:hypothetical protein
LRLPRHSERIANKTNRNHPGTTKTTRQATRPFRGFSSLKYAG